MSGTAQLEASTAMSSTISINREEKIHFRSVPSGHTLNHTIASFEYSGRADEVEVETTNGSGGGGDRWMNGCSFGAWSLAGSVRARDQ